MQPSNFTFSSLNKKEIRARSNAVRIEVSIYETSEDIEERQEGGKRIVDAVIDS